MTYLPLEAVRAGIRVSCDVLHRAWRPYLHRNLNEIKLPKSLIAELPLELWPEVLARVPVPDDVTEIVLQS